LEFWSNGQGRYLRSERIGELVGAPPGLPYAERVQRLQSHGIALWDVCADAHRPGSLDASIAGHSFVLNPFADFFADHPNIRLVCFNGAKAAALYRRHVLPTGGKGGELHHAAVHQASPAHAAMPFEDRLALWRVICAASVS
jgi:double-stranded uracil-DNA glycosylase